MIFETHAHYDDEAFESDRETLLKSIKENGVGRIINVCASLESLEKTKKLMESFPFIYGAFGLHPDETGDLDEDVMNRIRLLCREEKAVAVGEIGLDYYWDKEQHKRQIYWFERQMELAREEKLPIIVHSRDAAADTLDTMKRVHAEEIGGVCHCFSYPKEIAREYINMGFYLGIGGVVTFNNAKKLKEVVAYAPLDRILLETDSPYLSPVPYRGKRNSSLNLPYIAQMISEIKEIDYEEVIAVTEKNAEKLFIGENL
ncbi:MAG TPA: TatD family hydrolase [Candidatus Pelethocola excrementipullorum]|nr:TatD family hydrolase [Candidatus Pelethocola excrementipullorum]